MSCGVGHRCGSVLALLWLWCRPAAVTQILPLAWELPHALGAALKRKKKRKKKERKKQKKETNSVCQFRHFSFDFFLTQTDKYSFNFTEEFLQKY